MMQSSSIVDDISQNFESVNKLQSLYKLLDELSDNLNESKKDIATNEAKFVSLNEAKWNLKHRLIHLLGRHEFLLQLRKDPEKWMSKVEIDKRVEEMQQEYSKHKKMHTEMSSKINDLRTHFEEAEHVIQSRNEFGKRLDDLKQKKLKYEELLEQSTRKQNTFEGLCDTKREAEELINEQNKKIAEKMSQIDDLEDQREIELQNDEDLHNLIEMEMFFDAQKGFETDGSPKSESELSNSILEKLSGVKVISTKDDFDHLRVYYSQRLDEFVTVELHYARQKPPYPTKLIDVKIDDPSIHVEDLISRAISRNDFTSVIPALQNRLDQKSSLKNEIKELQKSSAIDWIPDESCLKLIVGSHTCSLIVPAAYPSRGEITLTQVSGMGETEFKHLHPLQKDPTLTDWVNFLELHLSA